jgi:ABC-2 type transport system ATP-binding protein
VENILEIRDLSKHFGHIRAVQHLNLQVEQGNVYGLLGPNGSGKTTTLALIMGLLQPKSGSFTWFNGRLPGEEWNRQIGSLIEVPNFYTYLSLSENLKVVCLIKKVSFSDIERVLGIAGLLERKKSRFDTLSLGMKQRLGLAAAMLGNPGVLVLDEPTNGLDPEGISEVREIILELAGEGKTILLASHILAEVEKVCTHVAILKQGELLASGRVGELLRDELTIVVSSDENEKLYELLVRSGDYGDIVRNDKQLQMTVPAGTSPGEINRFAFEKGIVLNKLEVLKRSLEAEFMELVKKN